MTQAEKAVKFYNSMSHNEDIKNLFKVHNYHYDFNNCIRGEIIESSLIETLSYMNCKVLSSTLFEYLNNIGAKIVIKNGKDKGKRHFQLYQFPDSSVLEIVTFTKLVEGQFISDDVTAFTNLQNWWDNTTCL